jgi:hypothetical protein
MAAAIAVATTNPLARVAERAAPVPSADPLLPTPTDSDEGAPVSLAFNLGAPEGELAAECVSAFTELRSALRSSSGAREFALKQAWERSRNALIGLQRSLQSRTPPRLLASVRLSGIGSTLLHLAVLWKLHARREFSVVHLLLRRAPPLLSATYAGALYRDENLLHMAVAHGDGELVLELAAFALQQHAGSAGPSVVGGKGYLYGDANDEKEVIDLRDKAWAVLHAFEAGRNAAHEPLGVAWCASWLRAAWIGMVNREATGTFFMPPPRGECFYGGTPLAFAVVLGHASIVRTLVVDVGCVDKQQWLTWRSVRRLRAERADRLRAERTAKASHAAAAVGGKGALQRREAAAADADSRQVEASGMAAAARLDVHYSKALPLLLTRKLDDLGPMELLNDWDPDVCARIDLHESHRGNTCAHMAILTSEDSAMFFMLDDLYSAGYGRWNSADLYFAKAFVRSQLRAYKRKAARAERGAQLQPQLPKESLYLQSPTGEAKFFASLRTSLDATDRVKPPDVFSIVRRQVLGPQVPKLPSVGPPPPRATTLALLAPCVPQDAAAAIALPESPPATPARGAGSAAERSGTSESPPPSPTKTAESSAVVRPEEERKALAKLAERGAEDGSRPRLDSIINKEGLTAQTLAASLGNREQFVDLWRARSKLEWTWGGVTRRQFPLDQVDDIGQCADDHPTIFNLFYDKNATHRAPEPSPVWRLFRQLLPISLADAGPDVAPTPRQPTALEQVVLNGHWRLLADEADKDEEELSSLRADKREAVRAEERELRRAEAEERRMLRRALLDAEEMKAHIEEEEKKAGSAAGAAGLSHALAVARARHVIASRRLKTAEQLAGSSRSHADDEEDDEEGAEGGGGGRGEALHGSLHSAALDGEEGEADIAGAKIARAGGFSAGTSLLRQLLQEKWVKVYRRLFMFRMVERFAFVSLLWVTVIVRTSEGVIGPSDGDAFPAEPLLRCSARLAAERLALVPGDVSDAQMAFRERSCAAAVVLVPLLAALLAIALSLQVVEIEARTRLLRNALSGAGSGGALSDGEKERIEKLDTAVLRVELARRGVEVSEDASRVELLKKRLASPAADSAAKAGFSSRAATLWHAGHGSSLGRFYLGTRFCFLVFSLAAVVVDIVVGWAPSTSILYALGGFAGTLHMLYFLVGFAKTGPLVMMIYSSVLSEFGRWLFVFLPLILSFTIAFFALNASHSWADLVNHDLLYAFQTSTVSGQAEGVLNDNSNVEGSANARMWLGFFIVANFLVYLLLTTLLIALVTQVFTVQMKNPRSRWHLERARAAFMIEASLSSWSRLEPQQKGYFGFMHRFEWMMADEPQLPQRPYFAATENTLAAERELAGRRKAGSLRGFISAATRAFLDEK